MEKTYKIHYIIDTYDETTNYRTVNMSEVIDRYERLTDRIRRALIANDIDNPEDLITYSFRMLGDYQNGQYLRKELVEVNLDILKEDLVGFPWENWNWVKAFQPVIDVAGYTIAEIDNELQSFGPSLYKDSDYVQPCFRIYENGRADYKRSSYKEPKKPKQKPWFDRVKEDFLEPAGTALKENIPTILAVCTTVAAVIVMMNTAQASVEVVEEATRKNEELLRHIEETIEDAVELPQIVKVELGDDYEVIGSGHRTW